VNTKTAAHAQAAIFVFSGCPAGFLEPPSEFYFRIGNYQSALKVFRRADLPKSAREACHSRRKSNHRKIFWPEEELLIEE
jgi:hypothetical protein